MQDRANCHYKLSLDPEVSPVNHYIKQLFKAPLQGKPRVARAALPEPFAWSPASGLPHRPVPTARRSPLAGDGPAFQQLASDPDTALERLHIRGDTSGLVLVSPQGDQWLRPGCLISVEVGLTNSAVVCLAARLSVLLACRRQRKARVPASLFVTRCSDALA